ncbi:MAG: nucleotide exchange factor GrpE [Bacteroidales bacterium]|nr:nucleotide exchange factor GrpE [Bacteroidales bacterium]
MNEEDEQKRAEKGAQAEAPEQAAQETAQQAEGPEAEVETLKAKLEESKNDYLRLYADFENFRRHSSEDRLKLIGTASADLIKGMLPVLDDCERAVKMTAETAGEDSPLLEGVNLIYNKLLEYLKGKGLAIIEAKGKDFDTDLHEAVAQFPVQDEAMKGKVFDVAQTGYTLNGEIIRHAKVVVGI